MTVYLAAAGIFVCIVFLRILYETHTFRVTRYEVRSDKFPEMMKDWKIVFLSDLHNQEYGEKNQKLIDAIRKERPDLILVGGDMLIRGEEAEIFPAVRFMGAMTKICPVYCANGNHEQQMKEGMERYGDTYANYRAHLVSQGVHMLENETALLTIGGMESEISGIEIPVRYYGKGLPWKGKKKFEGADVEELQKKMESSRDRLGKEEPYRIFLVHQPLYAEEYVKWGADLILCGHLHGGIVRLPFLGGVISPQLTLFPKYSGDHYKKGESDIIVSKGLGTHSFTVRLFNRAEVVVITGKKKKQRSE